MRVSGERWSQPAIVGGAVLERLSMKIRLRNLRRLPFCENWTPRNFPAIWYSNDPVPYGPVSFTCSYSYSATGDVVKNLHICYSIDNIDYVTGIGNSSREQYIHAGQSVSH